MTIKRPVGRPPRFTLEECREITRLHYEDRISYSKLAKRFGVGVGTIDRAMRRALRETV